ncbi:MAG: hypothetical protein WA777_18180 [Rhodanobacter sp.]
MDAHHEEGARPSSLIPVHKLATPDRLYDLQLLRDLAIVNERTARELGPMPPGGLPVIPKRKPKSWRHDVLPVSANQKSKEDEVMKLTKLAAVAALAAGTMACNPVASTSGTTAMTEPVDQGKTTHLIEHIPVETTKPKLGPDYKKIGTFVEFRKKLIADGWVPMTNPHCHDAVKGNAYDEVCKKDPGDISCRVCDVVPEIFRSTSDGYNVMHYTKNGTPLSVTVYGDMRDLDEPGRYAAGFVVSGWEYTTSLNVIPMEYLSE